MVRLIESSLKPTSECRIALVVSNVAKAKGIETAQSMGIKTKLIPSKGATSREAFEKLITKVITFLIDFSTIFDIISSIILVFLHL